MPIPATTRRLVLLGLGVLVAGGCTRPLPRTAWCPGLTILGDDAEGVPLVTDSAGLFYVDVTLNGAGPFRLLVDTGAAGLFLSEDVAQAAGAVEVPNVRVQAVNGAGQALAPRRVVRIDTVDLGSHHFADLHAFVHDREWMALPTPTPYDGVLGTTLFHDALLVLDLPGRRLHLRRGHLRAAAPVSHTHNGPRDVPILDLTLQAVGGRAFRCPAVIDTGANTLELPERVQRWPLAYALVREGRVHELGGQQRRVLRYRLRAQLTLGESHCLVTDPIVGFQGSVGRIGTGVLQSLILVLDQRRRRLALVPGAQRDRLDALLVDGPD